MHIQIISLYHKNRGFFDNITGLTKKVEKSHVTVRNVVKDLIDVGILKETTVGRSRVVALNEDGYYTKIVFEFLDNISFAQREEYLEMLMMMKKQIQEKEY
ncbi:MAG TPA: hypothetical protein EYP22_03520 [Methanosarcinales archaeon]|nr:hypothetical protein [Methanosarcinales archaeon]